MKIYLAHSSGFDYERELYKPLKQGIGKEYDIYFPHDDQNADEISKEIIASSDLVIAEVSYPSTGLGIELGWADTFKTPIHCIHKVGRAPSNALGFVADTITEYGSAEELPEVISVLLADKKLDKAS